MHVALLTVNAGHGGVVHVVWQLAAGLKSRGHEVTVLCDAGDQLERLGAFGVRHVSIRFAAGWRGIAAVRDGLRRFYGSGPPDIVHSHSRWPSLGSLLAGRRPDVTSVHADVLTSHGSVFDRGFVRRALSVWGNRVVAVSDEAREWLIREAGLQPERVVVIANGVDPARFRVPTDAERAEARRALGLETNDAVAVCVGSLVSEKGVDIALRALAKARSQGAGRLRLLIVGDGPERQALQTLAAALEVEPACRFLGWRDPGQAYAAGDLLVLPSRLEGFALVCVEAMLCGLPVLRTRRGGCRRQIIEGETGWSIAVDDTEALARILSDAAADPSRVKACGRKARDHAAASFTESLFLDRTIRLYESLVARTR
jgi:glycosyltransferase involved in cell wall biosynthesis